MESYSGAHRAFCVRAYYQNANSIVTAQRLYRHNYRTRRAPGESSIRRWIDMFENTGATIQIPNRNNLRTVRDEETIEEVRLSIRQNPSLSVRKRSQQLQIKKSSLHVILKKDLRLKAYKIQLVQELKPTDYLNRVTFVQEMMNRFRNFNNILFSDEANFHLNGHVNKQNCRYWAPDNPKLKHQRPLHSPKLIVWAAMSARGLIGPYFFEDERERSVTVNSDRYCHMLRDFLASRLQEFDGFNSRTWFQQDGATCHTSNESMAAVTELFANKVISRRGTIEWPPRSPDLSPLDYYLWGYLKSVVYENKPTTLMALKQNITTEMAAISRATCQGVINNLRSRFEECLQREGRHLDNIIFKK